MAAEFRSSMFDFAHPSTRRSLLLFAVGALIGLITAGYGLFTAKGTRMHTVPPEDMALVNNRPVLRSDFMTQVETQFSVPFAQATSAERSRVLQDMLAEELQVQRGLEIDLPSFDPDVRSAMVAGVELEIGANVLAQQPDEATLRAYYESHQSKYVSEGIMKVRDLVLRGQTDADAALARVRETAGALRAGTSIEKVMQRDGLTDSGRLTVAGQIDTGEILEFAARAKLAPAVYAAAAQLHSGEISDPVKADDGVHVIVMLEHRMPVQQDYAAAADRVWTDLRNESLARVREANLSYLRSRADIELSSDAQKLAEVAR